MEKWFIEWEDPNGNWLDAQEFVGDLDAALKEVGCFLNGNWCYTSPTNALCLPYHGGWIAQCQIIKDKKHAGYIYSQDGTKIPKIKLTNK